MKNLLGRQTDTFAFRLNRKKDKMKLDDIETKVFIEDNLRTQFCIFGLFCFFSPSVGWERAGPGRKRQEERMMKSGRMVDSRGGVISERGLAAGTADHTHRLCQRIDQSGPMDLGSSFSSSCGPLCTLFTNASYVLCLYPHDYAR